jgi:hypothetical protein
MNTFIGIISLIAAITFFTKATIQISVDKNLKEIFSFNPFKTFQVYKFFLPMKNSNGINLKLVTQANWLLIIFYCLFALMCVLIIIGRANKTL